MKRTLICFFIFLLSVAVSAQVNGSGTSITETRNVSGFTTVTLSTPGTLTITQGSTEALTITGDDNIVPLIQTAVAGNELTISSTQTLGTVSLNYELTVINITAINNILAGTIKSNGGLTSTDLNILNRNNGVIELEVAISDNLTVNNRLDGNITLIGSAKNHTCQNFRAGTYISDNLLCETITAKNIGSGSMTINATANYTINIDGDGPVSFVCHTGTKFLPKIEGTGELISLGCPDTGGEDPGNGDNSDEKKCKCKRLLKKIIERLEALEKKLAEHKACKCPKGHYQCDNRKDCRCKYQGGHKCNCKNGQHYKCDDKQDCKCSLNGGHPWQKNKEKDRDKKKRHRDDD